MEAKILINHQNYNIIFDGSENDLFYKIGELFLEESKKDLENINIIGCLSGEDNPIVKLSYKKRGTYLDKAGNAHNSMHCSYQSYVEGILPASKKKKYSRKELRCINSLGNNYKKYIIEIDESNNLIARYGSIDVPIEKCKKVIYEKWLFWPLYFEKLSKGYQDFSNILKDSVITKKENSNSLSYLVENANEKLYEILYNYSKGVISDNLLSQIVTIKQAEKARKLFEELKEKKTVKGFNSQLEKIMLVSPRKRDPLAGDKISEYLAKKCEDFANIIDFEESLVSSMETVAYKKEENASVSSTCKAPYFEEIKVSEATDAERQEVLSYLEYSLQNRVKRIFKVIPKKEEKIFEEYLEKNNIKNIKKLWHGSLNGNWFSITKNGLTISKYVAHGRMFGNGIYFAPSSSKSFGYTSYIGSRWGNGKESSGMMGLYKTAYGNPFFPKSYGGGNYTQEDLLGKGYNCVHARSIDTGLHADEIIFYDTSAVLLEFIVEFN